METIHSNAAIRQAEEKDISRIAEILVFTKRVAYRPIFQNDMISFGEYLQVLPVAEQYSSGKEPLQNVWLYDDGIVKGLITFAWHKNALEIEKLYVDWFFQGMGVGDALMAFAIQTANAKYGGNLFLWVLEKNEAAIRFYRKHGFVPTGERKPEEGTPEYLLQFERTAG